MSTEGRIAVAAVVALLTGGGVGPALAGDPTAEALYGQVCRTCHGPTAKGMASFPRLAGKEADYLADRLTRYRSGERMGPNTALMAPHAADLSDDEITALSLYLAGLS